MEEGDAFNGRICRGRHISGVGNEVLAHRKRGEEQVICSISGRSSS